MKRRCKCDGISLELKVRGKTFASVRVDSWGQLELSALVGEVQYTTGKPIIYCPICGGVIHVADYMGSGGI